MYPDLHMQESIKKVEAARAENVKLDPRRMTAEFPFPLQSDFRAGKVSFFRLFFARRQFGAGFGVFFRPFCGPE